MKYYIHHKIGERVDAISGYFQILEEGKMQHNNREFLYIVEFAHAETTCCGCGSAYVIKVPCYIVSYKSNKDIDGLSISEIEPVTDENSQKEIRQILKQKFPSFAQIDFI